MRTFLELEARAREKRLAEVKSSVKDCAKRLADEWLEIDLVFLEVMKTVEDTWQRALQPLEQRRLDMEKEASAVLQKLEGDIGSFKRQMKEMEQNPSVQIISTAFADLLCVCCFLSSTPVNVTLDPETAHSCLVVSPDGKNVKDGGNRQEGADSPKKFTLFGSVLASNTFTSGRCYWEVEVTNKTGWDLGVASGKANRKGKINLHSGNGYWVIVHYEGSKYAALSVPATSLSLKSKPDRVGVFVDYEDGLVSFYNVTDQSHIYSYTGCAFSEEIHPYFSPHLRQNEMNAEPLVICPVEKSH
ncbi:E3 ubiquitin-protein ligase TRIM39 [Synchiropus picturatus]